MLSDGFVGTPMSFGEGRVYQELFPDFAGVPTFVCKTKKTGSSQRIFNCSSIFKNQKPEIEKIFFEKDVFL